MPLPPDFIASLSCPHPKDVLEELQNQARPKHANALVMRNEVSPSDLYCYFAARFGRPNGLQNFLRKDDSDNLIHWEWTMRGKYGSISFQGMNFRTEVWLFGDLPYDESVLLELAAS